MRQQEVNMKISTEVIIALLASFAISVVLSPIIIPFLKRLKIGQTERTEGVQSHLEKAGTPTMGGLIILISVLVVSPFKIRLICEDVTPILLASSLWEICCFSHSFTIRSPGVLNDSSSDFAFSSISFTSVMIFHLSLYSRFSPLYFNTEYHLLQICITPAR